MLWTISALAAGLTLEPIRLEAAEVGWQYAPSAANCSATPSDRCGPSEWSKIDPHCGVPGIQSPINLNATGEGEEPEPVTLTVNRKQGCEALQAEINQHTVMVTFPEDCGKRYEAAYAGKTFHLLQFHFHSPSEHTVNGEHLDAEMHMVHKAEDGSELVFALFLKKGESNPHLAEVWRLWAPLSKAATGATEPVTSVRRVEFSETLNPWKFLDEHAGGFYQYNGTFTTPPCDEAAKWVIFEQPESISEEQLELFRRVVQNQPGSQVDSRTDSFDNRPIQDAAGRRVLYSPTKPTVKIASQGVPPADVVAAVAVTLVVVIGAIYKRCRRAPQGAADYQALA